MNLTKTITVLIVDDSATYRQFLRDALASNPRIEVVSIASNGRLALPRVRHYKPDFIILDHEMPEMTGIDTLREIRRLHPTCKVIMFSSHTIEGARLTLEALKEGATDFVTKPTDLHNETPVDYIKRKLINRIIELAEEQINLEDNTVIEPTSVHTAQSKTKERDDKEDLYLSSLQALPGSFDVVAIGISTGGPVALRNLFHLLAKGPPLRGSILIVQHMPPVFTKQLADSLKQETGINTVEAANGMKIEPATAYIAPGGLHFAIEKRSDGVYAVILDTEPENSCKPSVDVLFRSVAQVYHQKAVGVIMTGMGHDGYLGMKAMRQERSYLIAQSKQSCLVYGMPSKPTDENIVNEALSIEGIANRIRYLLGD